MARTSTALLLLLFFTSTLLADNNRQVLLEFEDSKSVRSWRAINDGVMGGRSVGRYRWTNNKMLEFYGRLSLENNGGFASIRLPSGDIKLQKGDVLLLQLKGDGRTYNMNLYAQRNLGGFSYRQSFKTVPDKLIEVQLPVDKFVATWRGRVFPRQKLAPQDVAGLGFLLGDKKEGEFRLLLKSISVQRVTAN
ncbi:MAG: CIA30 family protein [Planctomycetaceae bacterium]|nr:CIA30 family protein [Planctomycetaceae bacterium]|tara:strand:+ start:3209 stop:3784 length:576 start_codon:yes stop_codon:yes gene_type:complete